MGGHAELRNSTAVARVEQRLWPAVGGKIERFFRPPFPSSSLWCGGPTSTHRLIASHPATTTIYLYPTPRRERAAWVRSAWAIPVCFATLSKPTAPPASARRRGLLGLRFSERP